MPLQIDTEALDKAKILDLGKPPMKQIPHMEYPKCIYLHPKDKVRTVRVKDERGVVVEEYKEPTTHKAKIVQNADELKAAMKEGWKREPYLPCDLPDEMYEPAAV